MARDSLGGARTPGGAPGGTSRPGMRTDVYWGQIRPSRCAGADGQSTSKAYLETPLQTRFPNWIYFSGIRLPNLWVKYGESKPSCFIPY
jgi:hypothetical protein